MKKLLLLMITITLVIHSNAQSATDIFKTKEVVWYGLDFSQVKLVGSAGFTDVQKIKDVYFDAMNNVVATEKDKYNIEKIIRKSYVEYDLSIVSKQNQLPEVSSLLTDNPDDCKTLDEAKVQAIVSSYKIEGKNGIGLVYIMESLDKKKEQGSMFVTFFDIATKQVLITERFTGAAGGIGFRNYWVKPVYNVMNRMAKRYVQWQKMYKD